MAISLLVSPLMVAAAPVAAFADTAGPKYSQAPAVLSWIHLTDSRGYSIWNYWILMDHGGVTHPGRLLWSFFIDLFWVIYECCVAFAVWLISWALSFSWLQALASPIQSLSSNLGTIVARFGLAPVMLTVTAVVAVLWMMRGRWATGLFELVISLFIGSLAIGALADPTGLVSSDHGGWLMQSRDMGFAVSNGLAHGGNTGGNTDQMRERVSQMLVDDFIRIPAQLINFGHLEDGTPCEPVYDDVVKKTPSHWNNNGNKDLLHELGQCDPAAEEAGVNPSAGQAVSAAMLFPAAGLILLLAILMALAVLLAAANALYQSLKAVVTLIVGMLPGGARGPLWRTAADLIIALVTVTYSIVFLTGFLLLIQWTFQSQQQSGSVMRVFVFIDILLVVGLLLFWRGRKALQRASDKLAAAFSARPGTGPTALPARGAGLRNMAGPAAAGAVAYAQTKLLSRTGTKPSSTAAAGQFGTASTIPAGGRAAAGAAATSSAAGGSSPVATRQLLGAGPQPGAPGGPSGPGGGPSAPPPGGGPSEQIRRRVGAARSSGRTGRLVRAGTTTVVAVASGGTSAVAQKATAGAVTARRVAVARRLTSGHRPATTATRQGRPNPVDESGHRPATTATSQGRPNPVDESGHRPATTATSQGGPSPVDESGRLRHRRQQWDRMVRGGQVVLVPRRDDTDGSGGAS